MAAPRILALAGSTRADSYNDRLVRLAAAGAREAGAQVTHVRLRDFPLPLYDADLEAAGGLPPPARELKALFKGHDGLLIASPEYNGSLTGVLKNALDWVSRREPDEPARAAFVGKAAAVMSASTGALGGQRGLVHLRSILTILGVLVLPEQLALPQAQEAFLPDGSLADPQRSAAAAELGAALARLLQRLLA